MEAPTSAAIEKPRRWVYLVRIGFCLAIVGEILGGVIALDAAWQNNMSLFSVAWLLLLPCVLYLVNSLLSLGAFPFDYSFLGRFVPAPPPLAWRPVASAVSSVQIGDHFHASLPLLNCSIGPGGVLLRVVFYPPVFIASAQIVSISSDWWGRSVIEHTSQEIRGPIRVLRNVAAEMERCMPELARNARASGSVLNDRA